MNIVFVTFHTCARASKMAEALAAADHDVIILQHLAASEEILYSQPLSAFYRNESDLADKVQYFNDWADLFHVHNEPDWPVRVVAQNTSMPVIYDCHDLDSQRKGEANPDEIVAMEMAGGMIFPSKAYFDGATVYHGIKKPTALIRSMCTLADYDFIQKNELKPPQIEALVYEGHHIAPIADTDFAPGHNNYYDYRDYREFVMTCTAHNIPTAFYGTRPQFADTYRATGALVNNMLPYRTMLTELTRYTWGFCGHPTSTKQWNKALPNKLFEYLICGVPIIAWNCKEIEEFVENYEVGVAVDSFNELIVAFYDTELRKDCAIQIDEFNMKHTFTMENEIENLLDLYRAVKHAI